MCMEETGIRAVAVVIGGSLASTFGFGVVGLGLANAEHGLPLTSLRVAGAVFLGSCLVAAAILCVIGPIVYNGLREYRAYKAAKAQREWDRRFLSIGPGRVLEIEQGQPQPTESALRRLGVEQDNRR